MSGATPPFAAVALWAQDSAASTAGWMLEKSWVGSAARNVDRLWPAGQFPGLAGSVPLQT